jgi:hypothetical protein
MYSSIRTGESNCSQLVDALHQVLDRLAQRVERDPDRAVLARGLDDHRELQVVRPVEAPAVHARKIRSADPVEGEDLLGKRLVLREVEAAGAGARVLAMEQVEVGGEVDVLGVVARPRLGEVEHEVALGVGEHLERLGRAVHLDVERRMPVRPERLVDLLAIFLFGLPAAARRLRLLRLLAVVPHVVEHRNPQLGHRSPARYTWTNFPRVR